MARTMKVPVRKSADDLTLTITVDPLGVRRGPRQLPRGGAHRSARHPHRAQRKQSLQRQGQEE